MHAIPLVQLDLTRCPLPDAFADIVVMLNVLEHIGDDEAAIGEVHRIPCDVSIDKARTETPPELQKFPSSQAQKTRNNNEAREALIANSDLAVNQAGFDL